MHFRAAAVALVLSVALEAFVLFIVVAMRPMKKQSPAKALKLHISKVVRKGRPKHPKMRLPPASRAKLSERAAIDPPPRPYLLEMLDELEDVEWGPARKGFPDWVARNLAFYLLHCDDFDERDYYFMRLFHIMTHFQLHKVKFHYDKMHMRMHFKIDDRKRAGKPIAISCNGVLHA